MDADTLKRKLSFRRPTDAKLVSRRGVVATQLLGARTTWQLATGLMFRRLRRRQALVFFTPFRRRCSLHMWFVFHPIDIVLCDYAPQGFVVREVRRGLRPFSHHRTRREVSCFIEFPGGGAGCVRTGDVLTPKDI
ncbi:DUF192 domain-containing protein [Candidatus Woesearchaeota archaeon]|nr:DUF192 domain-containing protein [Candidatus Woesearchaeota archaeon]